MANAASTDPSEPRPDSPHTFALRQHELARDLLLKEAQIEVLIERLPGIDRSEEEQEARLRALEGELQAAERERRAAVAERERVLARLDEVIRSVKRA